MLNYQTVQYHCHPYIHPSTIMFTHFPKYTPDIIAVFPDTKRLVPVLSFPHESTVPGRVGVGFSPMARQWSKYVFLQLGTLKKVLAVLDSARETDGFFSLTVRRRFLKHGWEHWKIAWLGAPGCCETVLVPCTKTVEGR